MSHDLVGVFANVEVNRSDGWFSRNVTVSEVVLSFNVEEVLFVIAMRCRKLLTTSARVLSLSDRNVL